MKKVLFCFLYLLWIGYSCFAGIPKHLNRPGDAGRSIISVSVTQRTPSRMVEDKSVKVLFLKIENPGSGGGIKIIPSNYNKGGRIYLVAAEPGRYAVMAAYYESGKSWGLTFFSREALKVSEIEVKPGEFAFVGKFVIDNHCELSTQGDLTQKENVSRFREFRGKKEFKKLFKEQTGGDCARHMYRGTLNKYDRTAEALKESLVKAREDFKSTSWLGMLHLIP